MWADVKPTQEMSARGTPHTVRPSVGVGVPRESVEVGETGDAAGPGQASGVVVNPAFVKGFNPAAHVGNALVAAAARETALRLLRAHVATMGMIMGLHPHTMNGILTELACELVGPG